MLTMVLLAAALQVAPATAPVPDKKICRRAVVTGSIMPKRTCRTKAEWAQIDAATATMTDDAMRRRNGSPTSMREF